MFVLSYASVTAASTSAASASGSGSTSTAGAGGAGGGSGAAGGRAGPHRRAAGELPVDLLGDAEDLVTEDFVCKGEHPVQLVHRRWLGPGLEDHVVALPPVLELVGEAPLAPEVDRAALGAP